MYHDAGCLGDDDTLSMTLNKVMTILILVLCFVCFCWNWHKCYLQNVIGGFSLQSHRYLFGRTEKPLDFHALFNCWLCNPLIDGLTIICNTKCVLGFEFSTNCSFDHNHRLIGLPARWSITWAVGWLTGARKPRKFWGWYDTYLWGSSQDAR